jgi:protein gp37
VTENSKISWTDHTFNPWWGCQKVGPGCDHCYAEALDRRTGGGHWGPNAARRRTSPDNWAKPRKWNVQAWASGTRPRVFCASMADVFDNAVPADWRDDLWDLIRETPNLDWILLTKRVGNVAAMLPDDWGNGWPHVWLMITVVNQVEANRDMPKLARIPAVVHGLSIEPMLEPIDLFEAARGCNSADRATWWVICGAESGPGHRPFDEDWARALRDQCQMADVAFFYKQRIARGRKIETPDLDGQQHIAWPNETSPSSQEQDNG